MALPESGFLPLVPDLVVEVRSKWDTWPEIIVKVREYLAGGARAVWAADPRRKVVHVFRPEGPEEQLGVGQVLAGGDILPGLSIPVAELFDE